MDTSVQPVTPSAQPSTPGQSVPPTSSPTSSSNKGMWTAIIIVLLVVGGLGAYAFMSKSSMKSSTNTAMMQATPTKAMNEVMATPTLAPQASGLSKGTSDADLNQDSTSLTKDLNSANTQMSTVDQGLNDTPADLSQ